MLEMPSKQILLISFKKKKIQAPYSFSLFSPCICDIFFLTFSQWHEIVENADLIQVSIDLVIVQNLNAEVYVITVRQDDMFIFSLNKEMFPFSGRGLGRPLVIQLTTMQRCSFLFTIYGISLHSFNESSSIEVSR